MASSVASVKDSGNPGKPAPQMKGPQMKGFEGGAMPEIMGSMLALPETFLQMNSAGLAAFARLNQSWLDGMSQLGSEIAGFASDELREGLDAGQRMMRSRGPAEFAEAQWGYVCTSTERSLAETKKLNELGSHIMKELGEPMREYGESLSRGAGSPGR